MQHPTDTDTQLAISDLGCRPYAEVWELQKKLQQQRIRGEIPDTLLVCQHPTVITCGRSARQENILASRSALQARGVDVYDIERGGDVTLHNPGQIVLYPILYLGNHRKDVGWYMRTLEEVVIATCNRFQIPARRVDGKTGVWVSDSNGSSDYGMRKIASIGVRISRWVTMHGLALNVCNNIEEFQLITPCGLADIEITTLTHEAKLRSTSQAIPTIMQVQDSLSGEFSRIFGFTERADHAESNNNHSWNQATSAII